MKTSIRYIRIPNSSIKPALCFRGTKHAHCIINDETTVRAIELPVSTIDKARVVLHNGVEYPIPRFVEGVRGVGRRKGITRRASFLLDQAAVTEAPEDFAELPPDEAATDGTDPPIAARLAAGPSAEGPVPAVGGAGTASHKAAPRKTSKTKAAATPKPSAKAAKKAPPAADPTPKAIPETETGSLSRGTLVAKLAVEFKLDGVKLRKLLRSEGLRAPYDDQEQQIRKILNKLGIK